ncbi:hypothetical protein ATY27_13855 [Rheinheimera sp. F8]|nr:hypothetical protein ATY27_13855 [Rheinheimera sp. F8]
MVYDVVSKAITKSVIFSYERLNLAQNSYAAPLQHHHQPAQMRALQCPQQVGCHLEVECATYKLPGRVMAVHTFQLLINHYLKNFALILVRDKFLHGFAFLQNQFYGRWHMARICKMNQSELR